MPKDPRKKVKTVRHKGWSPNDFDTASRESLGRREDSGGAAPELIERDYFSEVEPNALVISPYGVLAFVLWGDTEHLCKVDESLLDGKTSVLAPGDRVRVEPSPEGPLVTAAARRKSKLSRPAVGRAREQVLAANIDTVVIVASAAKPMFKPGLVDRYLIAAQVGGAEPILCLNKIDLVEKEPPDVALFRDLGLRVIKTSCETRIGMDEVREVLRGKLSVLTGHSGVGKSSIINALDPRLSIATQDVSRSNEKGRHTTTSYRLYLLDGETRIIDTPGIKQLGLWGVSPAELDYYFHQIAELARRCRFRDCTHVHEPQCAVREAVETGELARARYDSYLRIRQSLVKEQ